MNKVTFSKDAGVIEVLVNGYCTAVITGSNGEYYLTTAHSGSKFIARFKYVSALGCAKHFAKNVLSQVTADQAAEYSAKEPPLVWAERLLGYESLNKQRAAQRRA